MPFKKGHKIGNRFAKGVSGNPKGQPRKLISSLKMNGYTKSEAALTINSMLAMTLDELEVVYKNGDILERTIAAALRKSLEKGSLYSLDTLLSRTHGKPTEMVEVNAEIQKTITVQFGSGNNQLQSTSSAMDGDKFIQEV
jgi:hypothetical protein